MSQVTENQPDGTPTWIDLGVPDLDAALSFYGSVFGWTYEVGPAEAVQYTICRLAGRAVAGIARSDASADGCWWNVYLSTSDCDATANRFVEAGGMIVVEPMDVPGRGRMAITKDAVGAQVGLWQGRELVGCELVNEPGTLVRNDLVTGEPERARVFYRQVFDFTLESNPDLPDFDFTFLRRPDGHEVGGIMGAPGAISRWATAFEVSDTDAALELISAGGGTAGTAEDFVYGRMATAKDPFGAEFTIITRAP